MTKVVLGGTFFREKNTSFVAGYKVYTEWRKNSSLSVFNILRIVSS
jgi:hypothetical protein